MVDRWELRDTRSSGGCAQFPAIPDASLVFLSLALSVPLIHPHLFCSFFAFSMPSFASSTKIRESAHGFSFALTTNHVFLAGHPSDTIQILSTRLPDNVQVFLGSNLILTLAGSFNGIDVSYTDIHKSALANHVVHYLRAVPGYSLCGLV